MKTLVVGTGRSGTGWCAQTLQSAGLDVGHEGVFGPRQALGIDLPDWRDLDGDCSWLAVPLLPLPDVRTALVVRHPLEVVASLLHIGFGQGQQIHAPYVGVVDHHHGDITGPDGLLSFWTAWNRQAARHADVTFTLASLVAHPDLLTRWAGATRPPAPPGRVNQRTEWKHGPRPDLTWDDFAPHLAEQAEADWTRYVEVSDGVRDQR